MKNKLSKQIVKLRELNELSQEYLASELNVTRQQISKWENNDSEPNIDMLLRLCKIFEVDLNELVIGTQPINSQNNFNEDFTRRSSDHYYRRPPQNFWEFASRYWWLIFPIFGMIMGLLGALNY